MGIQEDAGKLVIYIYQRYTTDTNCQITPKKIIDETKWEAGRINRAYTYLDDLGILKVHKALGNVEGVYNFLIVGLNPEGVNLIENKPQFKKSFGFEIGIPGAFKLNWSVSDK